MMIFFIIFSLFFRFRYCLTEVGENLALKLISSSGGSLEQSSNVTTHLISDTITDSYSKKRLCSSLEAEVSCSSLESMSSSTSQSLENETSEIAQFQLMPGSYEVVLLIDSSESVASRV